MRFRDRTFKEQKCPYCKSEDLKIGKCEKMYSGEALRCTCKNCGKFFYIKYQTELVFYRYENQFEEEIKL